MYYVLSYFANARIRLWVGFKASAALITRIDHSEDQRVVGKSGGRQPRPRCGSLLPFPHRLALAGMSSSRWASLATHQAGVRVMPKLIQQSLVHQPKPLFPLPHLPPNWIYLLKGDFCAWTNYSEVTFILKLIFDFTKSKLNEIFL